MRCDRDHQWFVQDRSHTVLRFLRSIEEAEFATLEWVGWFNNRRLLESIGNFPPTEFEMAYCRQ